MATISFQLKHKKNPATIYMRLSAGRGTQAMCSTKLAINYQSWSKVTNKILPSKKTKEVTNEKLRELSDFVLEKYHDTLKKKRGAEIDSKWLRGVIAKFHEIPVAGGDGWKTYFSDFLIYKNAPQHYINRFKEYEGKKKIHISAMGKEFSESYISWMRGLKFLDYTINQDLNYFKKILTETKSGTDQEKEIETLNEKWAKGKVTAAPIISLTTKEIDDIYNYDFSDDKRLYNMQTLFIFGVYSGCRISDLHQVSKANIRETDDGEFLDVVQKKTGHKVTIPVHPRVREYLERKHHFINRNDLGIGIKDIAKAAGLDRMVLGRRYNVLTKIPGKTDMERRTVEDEFPVHAVVSTHTMRKTFASRYYGKIPTGLLCQITGHKTETMLLKYIGKADDTAAKKLANVFQDED